MSSLPAPSQSSIGVLRVLIADDDPILRSVMKSKLASLAYDIAEAEDGFDAWEQLSSGNFALALVDLHMPNVDGFTLIQCARSHPLTRHMPIVVVTSRDDNDALRQALEAGASSYLTKPLNWSMFRAHIEHLMRMTQSLQVANTALSEAMDASRSKENLFISLHAEMQSRINRIAAIVGSPTETADVPHLNYDQSGLPQEVAAARLALFRFKASFASLSGRQDPAKFHKD